MEHPCRSTVRQCLAMLSLIVSFITLACADIFCQSTSGVYDDINKERLMLKSTAQYIFNISQGQIDMDSAMLMTSRIYGQSRLLAYNEGYSDGKPSEGTTLLDAGNVNKTKSLLSTAKGDARMRLLLDLGSYFIFKPGNAKADLDEAAGFIMRAIDESEAAKSAQWKMEALRLHAYLLSQSGRMDESQAVIAKVIGLAEQSGNKKALLQAHLDAALILPYTHPLRMQELEKALALSQSTGAKEKEIEVISNITVEHFIAKRVDAVEENLRKTLDLQLKIGYKHNQYAYDVLAYLADQGTNYTLALSYSNKSLECIASKADSVIAPLLYYRKAGIYLNLQKYQDGQVWLDKCLEGKTKETRLFWYKAFLSKARLFNYTSRSEEALTYMAETRKQFPPESLFEEMYFAREAGESYDILKRYEEAEASYNQFLSMAKRFPPQYIYAEFPLALLNISRFYCDIHKTDEARKLLEASQIGAVKSASGMAQYYGTLYKIDSADQKYLAAFDDLRKWKVYYDSASGIEQRKKAEELIVQYETEKKDKDIQLLKQQGELQEAKLSQSHLTRNITFAGAALLLFITGLLYYLYQTKQKSNDQLQHLLTEKDWLLKEVHHRVKNNLQTVLSLLESQSRQLSDEAFHAIQESQNRVYAMSLIHKKLYQSTDVASINMEDYLRDLVQHLRDSFGSSSAIRFSLQLDPVELDVSQAVPVGLIVNEAITNSIKYAFPEKGVTSKIDISLKTVNKKIVLTINDNGIGIAEAKTGNTQSLGLKLIRGLTEDIDGVYTMETKHGVTIKIEFVASVPLQKISRTVVPQLAIENA